MFFYFLVYHRIVNIVPCAIHPIYKMLIHPIYNSLHLLISNSQSLPPPPLTPLGNHRYVLYVCESVSVL